MALVIPTEPLEAQKCWACRTKIEKGDPYVVIVGEDNRIHAHPECAHSVMRKLINDLAELSNLGFDIDTS